MHLVKRFPQNSLCPLTIIFRNLFLFQTKHTDFTVGAGVAVSADTVVGVVRVTDALPSIPTRVTIAWLNRRRSGPVH